jgi:hypothetical protein
MNEMRNPMRKGRRGSRGDFGEYVDSLPDEVYERRERFDSFLMPLLLAGVTAGFIYFVYSGDDRAALFIGAWFLLFFLISMISWYRGAK